MTEDVQAIYAVVVEVRVVNFRNQSHLWRLERITFHQADCDQKLASFIRRALRTQ